MRWWCIGLLILLAGCDSENAPSSGGGSSTTLQQEASRFTSTQMAATVTVGDANLVATFPIKPIDNAEVKHVGRIERAGEPVTLQMMLKAPVPYRQALEYYESQLRRKGMRVRNSAPQGSTREQYLFASVPEAEVTVVVTGNFGGESTDVSIVWTEKLHITPGSAPATQPESRPASSSPGL